MNPAYSFGHIDTLAFVEEGSSINTRLGMMTLLTKMMILILMLVTLTVADDTLSIPKYWSGVVTEGREGKIACRASGQINKCRWRKEADTEKHKKFAQSKFDIFVLHRPFSGFYKGNREQTEEIYTDLKIFTQTWFAGLRVFPSLSHTVCQ